MKTLGKPSNFSSPTTQRIIALMEVDMVISDDHQVAEMFTNYFKTVIESFSIAEKFENFHSMAGITDPLDVADEKYANHPNTKPIAGYFPVATSSSFEHATIFKLETDIKKLNTVRLQLLMVFRQRYSLTNLDVCMESLPEVFNECVYEGLVYKQMMERMNCYLSDLLYALRQRYNAQHVLALCLENGKVHLDKR